MNWRRELLIIAAGVIVIVGAGLIAAKHLAENFQPYSEEPECGRKGKS